MKPFITFSVLALMLSACSQNSALVDLADGQCTKEQAQLVKGHISSQIDALAKKQWELAYSFASPAFRSAVGLEDFILIIDAQYEVLINNQGYEFNSCSITDSQITQDVGVKGESGVIDLIYALTVKDSTLGIEAAVISDPDPLLFI